MRLVSDERGLVGKLIITALVMLAVLAIVAVDGGSILLARSRAETVADGASASAAQAYRETGDEEAAKLAALDTIANAGEPVRLKRIDVGRRAVTVVVTTRADTMVVGKIPVIDDLARLTVSGSAAVPRD
jgi:uncharacterized membrane protein